jgi:geranylgeranyl reductase family protein
MYDVAVVGGGPAGAAAACAAAQAGARTVLVERARPPRYKRCGGGLLGVSAAVSGLDLRPVLRDEVSALTATLRGGHAWTRRHREPFLRTVNRDAFDAALLALAREAGAELQVETTVTGVEETSRSAHLLLRDRATPLRARTVIAADGVVSRLAAYVGVVPRQLDLGLEGEFAAPPGWHGRALLDWGPVPGSYGWLFPKGDLVTVGVIGDKARAEDLRRYYAELVASLGLGSPMVEGGHHVRVRADGSPLVSVAGRVLVAGDAAGLAEPWTREGISFALRSGRIAGELAATDRAARYPLAVQRVLQPEIAAGRRLLAGYERHPATFHLALASPPGWREFRQLLAGRTSLAALSRRLPVRIADRLLRP